MMINTIGIGSLYSFFFFLSFLSLPFSPLPVTFGCARPCLVLFLDTFCLAFSFFCFFSHINMDDANINKATRGSYCRV